MAQHLEIISKTFPTNQNSAHGIYDQYQAINDESHENPGTPGTKLKVFRNNLKMLCHPICNWLQLDIEREGARASKAFKTLMHLAYTFVCKQLDMHSVRSLQEFDACVSIVRYAYTVEIAGQMYLY